MKRALLDCLVIGMEYTTQRGADIMGYADYIMTLTESPFIISRARLVQRHNLIGLVAITSNIMPRYLHLNLF
jgi:hypothetical protein